VPNDLKAQTVQWAVDAARTVAAVPGVAGVLGLDRGRLETGLHEVEVALADYRAAPGASTADVAVLPPLVGIGRIVLTNPRLVIPLLVLCALAVGVAVASQAHARAARNLDDALRRWAERLFMSRRRPVTVTDLRALGTKVEEDFAGSGRGDRCREKYDAFLEALRKLKVLLNNPSMGGTGAIGRALTALTEALEALYGCLGMSPPSMGS
jgi:hypothetical protein